MVQVSAYNAYKLETSISQLIEEKNTVFEDLKHNIFMLSCCTRTGAHYGYSLFGLAFPQISRGGFKDEVQR
jgi:hypothetical protein